MASRTITPGTNDVSDYNSRLVTVEVTGGKHREMMRLGTYTLTIPYSCLSQTIQRIHRFGGKINHVTMPHFNSEVSKLESFPVLPVSAENPVIAPLKEAESVSPPSPPPSESSSRKDSANTRAATKSTNGKQGQRSKRKK
jgi:hypothetical protein